MEAGRYSPKHQMNRETMILKKSQGGRERLFNRRMRSSARSSLPRYPAMRAKIKIKIGIDWVLVEEKMTKFHLNLTRIPWVNWPRNAKI